MALSETDTSDCNSDSSVDGTKQERKEKLFTKIVVRRLPPSMNKESFLNQVSPLPDYDYMYFVRADMSLGEFAFSRAYINFKNSTDIFIFKEKFDNYVFLDSKGNEYAAVVEFAPFSRIPKKRNKIRIDPKCSSIETDPIYTEFVESLNQVSNETEEKPEYCFQPTADDDKKITNTPLLDFVKQRRIDRQKIKEEKREERKRRENERKRIKEEERRGRKKIEHVSHSSSVTKIVSAKSSSATVDANDENKSETSPKPKDRKTDDYRTRVGKSGIKEYGEKRTYSSSKDIHRSIDKKSPTKIRPRNQNIVDREPRREYKSKREDIGLRHKKEEEKTEKKVKKYSERREERKNEFKRQESKSSETSTNAESEKPKTETKGEDNKTDTKPTEEKKEREDSKGHETKEYETERCNQKENNKLDKSDPRTGRRIRNKDRPTMAIYQPGMLRNRNKPGNGNGGSDEGQKNDNIDNSGSETNKTE